LEQAFWQDRPVLVTGATGHIGGWLVKRLLNNKTDVVCLVRDWVPKCDLVRTGLIKQVKIVQGDLRDMELLRRMLGEYEINTVFHLAAQSIVGTANRDPEATFDTNIAAHGPYWKPVGQSTNQANCGSFNR
jgi:CDP-glucose 4,6-dehydratase